MKISLSVKKTKQTTVRKSDKIAVVAVRALIMRATPKGA